MTPAVQHPPPPKHDTLERNFKESFVYSFITFALCLWHVMTRFGGGGVSMDAGALPKARKQAMGDFCSLIWTLCCMHVDIDCVQVHLSVCVQTLTAHAICNSWKTLEEDQVYSLHSPVLLLYLFN